MGDYYITGDIHWGLTCRHYVPELNLMVFISLSSLYYFFLPGYNKLTEQYLEKGILQQSSVFSLSLLLFFFTVWKYFYTVRELTSSGDSSVFRQRNQAFHLRCNRLIFPIRHEFIQNFVPNRDREKLQLISLFR